VLLARLRVRLGPVEPARAAVERALADLEAHLNALERLFPVEIDRHRKPEALLAARTAATLLRFFDSLGASGAGPLRARLEQRVRDWEQRLKAAVPDFVASASDPLGAAMRAHERRRGEALAALEALARKEAVARPAVEQVRSGSERIRQCPAPTDSGAGSLPTP
jgi:hypothetical protein